MSNLTGYEKETIILYNNAEETATITTYDSRTIRKLLSNKDATILEKDVENDNIVFVKAILNKKLVSIREKRNLSDEQKQAFKERMGYTK